MTVARTLSQAVSSTKDDKTYVNDVFNTTIATGQGWISDRYIKTDVDLRDGGFIWAKSGYNYLHSPNMLGILGYDHGAGEYPDYGWAIRTTVNTSTQTIDITYDPNEDIIFDYKENGFVFTDTTNIPVNKSVFHSFKKHKRFCDVVTYVGDNDPNRTIPHELEVEPGLIIIRRFDDFTSADPGVYYHGKFSNQGYNESAGFVTGFSLASETQADYLNADLSTPAFFGMSLHTESTFSPGLVRGDIGTSSTYFNTSGVPYIAFLLAHDPEGPNGDDGLIAIGHYAGGSTGGQPFVDLGWKPQYLFVKDYNRAGTNTYGIGVMDRMLGGFNHRYDLSSNYYRGDGSTGPMLPSSNLYPNTDAPHPDPSGFTHVGSNNPVTNTASGIYLFIAVRDGPYREKESARELFAIAPKIDESDDYRPLFTSGFPVDFALKFFTSSSTVRMMSRDTQGYHSSVNIVGDYLGGGLSDQQFNRFDYADGWGTGYSTGSGAVDYTEYSAMWRKSPKFFTTVEYAGDGGQRLLSHDHGKAPDLVIHRSMTTNQPDYGQYIVWSPLVGRDKYLNLASDHLASTTPSAGGANLDYINYATETHISFGGADAINKPGVNSQLLMFSSLENVAKIGKYYGTGTVLNINCGFSNHVRFLLIKRLDAAGDWIMTGYYNPGGLAQGFTADSDYFYSSQTPYRSLNDTSATEFAHDWIRHYDGGFTLNTDPANAGPGGTGSPDVNADGGEYLYYAISY